MGCICQRVHPQSNLICTRIDPGPNPRAEPEPTKTTGVIYDGETAAKLPERVYGVSGKARMVPSIILSGTRILYDMERQTATSDFKEAVCL